jgi:DNA polymerase-3 subunit gamma/tau
MDTDAIRRAWPDVLGRIFGMRRATWTFVSQHAQVLSYDSTSLTLGIGTVGLTNTFRQGNHAELVRQALIDELGIDVVVDGVPMPEGGAPPAPAGAVAPPAGSVPRATDDPPAPAEATSVRQDAGRGQGPSAAPSAGQSAGSAPDPGLPAMAAAPAASRGPSALQHNGGWGSTSGAAADWASAAPTSPAPDWATAGPATPVGASARTGQTTQVGATTSAPAPPAVVGSDAGPPKAAAVRGASAVRQSFAQARSAGSQQPSDSPRRVLTDDSAVSDDDEDIEQSGDVGRAVIEKVLGGRVVSEADE